MAVPKRRKSKMRQRTARAHLAMTAPKVVSCPNCQAAALPHRVCPSCGHFQGRQVEEKETGDS